MLSLRFLFIVLIGLLPAVASADFLPDTSLHHEPMVSFVAGERLFLKAQIDDSKGIIDARCYFKVGDDGKYIYVSMDNRSEDFYQCTLPGFEAGAKTVEYFFLTVNGSRQVVRSTPYLMEEVAQTASLPEQTDAVLSPLNVYIEFGDVEGMDTGITDDSIEFAETEYSSPLDGLRAGIYEEADLPDSMNYTSGYFGGFTLDPIDNTIKAVKGFADNLVDLPSRKDDVLAFDQSMTVGVAGSSYCPDIAGDNWMGYFTRTDSDAREYLTAVIVVSSDCHVNIQTTLVGLGHFFDGIINSQGDMLLYDAYDGEDWTTWDGPATEHSVRIYDYIYPPSPGAPPPPLNSIIFYRPPYPPAEIYASNGTFLGDKVAVNWSAASGATSYEVYSCTDSDVETCTFLAQTSGLQYDDSRKIIGVIYYRVKSCGNYGCSELSNYASGWHLIAVAPMVNLLL